jgi:hypothetical protein
MQEQRVLVLSGVLRDNQGPVEGFISIQGDHGAPGFVVNPDGRFEVEISDESLEDQEYIVYVFAKGRPGGPEIPVNFLRLGSVYIEINVEAQSYTVQSA